MRENLVLTSACARAYARPSVQTLEDGEGSPKATRLEEENVIFSWREILRCFWATSAAKRLFDSVEVSNVRKISNIYRWKRKRSKEYSDVFWVLGLHLCCRFCYELGRYNAWVCSGPATPNIAEIVSFFFVCPQLMVFVAVRTHFPRKTPASILIDRAAINKQLFK